jgi:hypothetical protein
MNNSGILRPFGAAFGLLSAALLFASGIVNDITVPAVSSSSTIAAALLREQTRILVGTYLLMLGAFFLVLFTAYLRHYLVLKANEDNWLISVAFGGGLIAASMLLLSAHFGQAFTILSSYGSETQVAKALYLLDWNWYLLVEAPPIAAMVASIGVIGATRKVLPRWLSWSGILLAFLLLVPFITGGGIMLSYLWLGALALVILFDMHTARSHGVTAV